MSRLNLNMYCFRDANQIKSGTYCWTNGTFCCIENVLEMLYFLTNICQVCNSRQVKIGTFCCLENVPEILVFFVLRNFMIQIGHCPNKLKLDHCKNQQLFTIYLQIYYPQNSFI